MMNILKRVWAYGLFAKISLRNTKSVICFLSLCKFGAFFVCSWSLYVSQLVLKRKEHNLESVIDIFLVCTYVCVYVCVIPCMCVCVHISVCVCTSMDMYVYQCDHRATQTFLRKKLVQTFGQSDFLLFFWRC